MNIRRSLVAMLGLAALCTAVTVFAAPQAEKKVMDEPAKPKAKVGETAPAFTLKDADGTAHSLADYKGKIVVLQWINPRCPVCVRCISKGVVAKMLQECRKADKDLVHLTINSTHWMEGSDTKAYLAEHEVTAPGLIDRDGTVGHLYGARTTPHMFVIDQKGVLRYDGAIDNDRFGENPEAMNYVVNAVRQIKAGETVTPDQTKPYGCSVKYDKGKKK